MVTVLNQRVPVAVLLEVLLELLLFFLAILLPLALWQPGAKQLPLLVIPALLFAISMVLINGALGLYKLDRSVKRSRFVLHKAMALVLGLPIGYVALQLAPAPVVSQATLALSIPVSLLGVLLVQQLILSGIKSDLLTYRVLIVGTGPEARAVSRILLDRRGTGIRLVGYYKSDDSESVAVPADRIIPGSMSLETAIAQLHVREVVVAVKEQRGAQLPLRQLVDCRLRGVRITSLPTFYERYRGEIPIESLKASWLIYNEGFRQDRWRGLTKRAFDVFVASALLVLATPMMAIVALLIRLDSPGPAIIRQERVGLAGRHFRLVKFRSMRLDAEPDGAPKWAAANDGRVTRVGRLIRRTRIDELPQLINVLKGEMSFVGPRPERPYFSEMLTERIPFYGTRHSVKPGLTGWAQVSYSYGASLEDAIRKLQYDLYYVKNHTLLVDFLILLRTIAVVVSGKGVR